MGNIKKSNEIIFFVLLLFSCFTTFYAIEKQYKEKDFASLIQLYTGDNREKIKKILQNSTQEEKAKLLKETLKNEKEYEKYGISALIDIISADLQHNVPLEIEEFLARETKRLAITFNLSEYDQDGINSLKILQSINAITSFDDCVTKINKFISHNDVTPANEMIIFPILIQYILRAGFISYKRLLEDVYEIKKLSDYWIRQQSHQIRYFFKKSPHKWFFGKHQEDEIRENIMYLEQLQESCYENLGALASHLYKFNPRADKALQLKWMVTLLSRISISWGVSYKENRLVADTKDIMIVTKECLNEVKLHKKTFQELVAQVKKASHFVRNWIGYSIVSIGALYGYRYWSNNADQVTMFFQNKKESFLSLWNRHGSGPVERLYRYIFERKYRAMNNIAEESRDISKKCKQDCVTVSKVLERGKNNLAIELKNFGLSDNDIKKILDEEDAQIFINHWYKEKFILNAGAHKNGGRLLSLILTFLCKNYELKVNKLGAIGSDIIADSSELLAENSLNRDLLLLTPALIIGWSFVKGIRSLYNTLTNRNFYQLSVYIKDIEILLEEKNRVFSHYKYGKLLFLTHLLKYEVLRLIPNKHNMRKQMLDDIIRIENRDSSIDEKIALTRNIRIHYFTFLPGVANI